MVGYRLATLTIAATAVHAAGLKASRIHPTNEDNPPSLPIAYPTVCTCRNWKRIYTHEGVKCGAGQEFFFNIGHDRPTAVRLEAARKSVGAEICGNFYERLNFNKCVNRNIGSDRGQWCFVDAKCTNFTEGGAVPNSHFAWKTCEPGRDEMLRDVYPEDLGKIAQEHDVKLGLLHKMSYPLSKAWVGKRFPEVEAFWGIGNATAESLPKWLRKDMQKIMDTGKPYSFDNSLDYSTPHTIVVGKKVYSVQNSSHSVYAHPGSWDTLECLKGCNGTRDA